MIDHSLLEFKETLPQKKIVHHDVPSHPEKESYEKTEAQKSPSAKPDHEMK